ncbi:MAG: cupredoxin domain-containing protein [Aggregatilineales bacterium]
MNWSELHLSNRSHVVLVNRRRFLQGVGLGIMAVAASACAARPSFFNVTITDSGTFDPPLVVIPKGALVVFLNRNTGPYSVTCDPAKTTDKARVSLPAGAAAFDSGILYPGDKWQHTFDTPGDFRYTSVLGNAESAIGVIRVTA